ncbi:MAG: filamentous hemagglutinin N-terminal protein [Solimicrobium sp.]|nr:filamentous hemagglutinin N-terminal protein [Solimicrobium sp.]
MNHIYRLVWNKITNSWVAVPETARTRGKSGGGRAASKASILALLAGFGTTLAWADLPVPTTVVPSNNSTQAYISANTVPVVNIANPNAAGLSHNTYNKYNVEANGLVLNNGDISQVLRQSELAGQVGFNPNLTNQATVILNEVVSTDRSTLAGFTEVLGGKADVIVANPNGITCNGCGFINTDRNTDRATLTTGTPNIAADGSLTGFTVNRGDVLIEGLGANASTQQIFDIVTRSVKVDGKINGPVANSLSITTGNNIWNYATRRNTGSVTGEGTAPNYAIDSTILGGMYAGRISIIATEAGVGVRTLGEVAASTGDFILDSAGKVEIQSALSAAGDLSIKSTSTTSEKDLFLNGANAKVTAGHDLILTAEFGEINLTEGEIYAENNSTLTGATLSDVSTTGAKRFAKANNTITTTGGTSIDGSTWGAGGAFSGTFDRLSIGAADTIIYAGTTLGLEAKNNLSLAKAAVTSTGNMMLTSQTGAISTQAGTKQRIQSTGGDLSLTAGKGLTNEGTISTNVGSVKVRVDGEITNSGILHANSALDLADKTDGNKANITNSGTMLAEGNLDVEAAKFTNQLNGKIQGTTGTVFNATDLNNEGIFIASDTAGQTGTFTLTNLTNSGTLQSNQNLALNVGTTLNNSGKLLATDNLTVNSDLSALAITNTKTGWIQAGESLTMRGTNATLDNQRDSSLLNPPQGTLLGKTVDLTLSKVSNSGILQSDADMKLVIGKELTNSGTLLAKTNLSSNSASLNNSGNLAAKEGGTITTIGALTNTGVLIASDSTSHSSTLNVGSLSNTGSGAIIHSLKDLAINVSGETFTNAQTIGADNDLTITSTGSKLALSNQSGGYLQAGSSANDTLTIGGTAVTLNNAGDAFLLGDRLGFSLGSLDNAGTIQGGNASSTITSSSSLDNSGTLTLATGGELNSTITASRFTNSGTGTLQSASGMLLATKDLNNSGIVFSSRQVTLNSPSGNLYNSGVFQATRGLYLIAQNLENTGHIISTNDNFGSTLEVSTLSNKKVVGGGVGVIESAGELTVNLSGPTKTNPNSTLINDSKILAGKSLTINSNGEATIKNLAGGYLQSGNYTTADKLSIGTINSKGIVLNNEKGAFILGEQLDLNLSSLTNFGAIQDGVRHSTINVTGDLLNYGTLSLSTNVDPYSGLPGSSLITANGLRNTSLARIQSGQSLNLTLSGNGLINQGTIIAGNNLTLNSTGKSLSITNGGDDDTSPVAFLQAGSNPGDTLTIEGISTWSDEGTLIEGKVLKLNNKRTGNIIGDRLNLNLGDQLKLELSGLDNDGTILGGSSSDINVIGLMYNRSIGKLSLATNDTGTSTINADTINNLGLLQSGGAVRLNARTKLLNTTNMFIKGALTVRAPTIEVFNRMESGGLMDIKGFNGGNDAKVEIRFNGVLFGQSMNIGASSIDLDNGGMLTTSGDLTIAADGLELLGPNSSIVAATSGSGTATINLTGGYWNKGAVHSGGSLNFSASYFNNSLTGGISALKDLSFTSGTGFINYGSLYSGTGISISDPTSFTNSATLAEPQGRIDSGGYIVIDNKDGSFTNNSQIDAAGNITISARTIKNEVFGGDPPVETYYLILPKETKSTKVWGWTGTLGFSDQTYTETYQSTYTQAQRFTGDTPKFKRANCKYNQYQAFLNVHQQEYNSE